MTTDSYRYMKRWRLDRDAGRPRTVDAYRARRHIQRLRQAGWSYGAIGKAAGHRAGRATGLRDAHQARAEALGWMRVAITAEQRADAAEALLALDFETRRAL